MNDEQVILSMKRRRDWYEHVRKWKQFKGHLIDRNMEMIGMGMMGIESVTGGCGFGGCFKVWKVTWCMER